MPTALELKEERASTWERMKQIVDGAEAEKRDLTAEEEANWTRAEEEVRSLEKRIERQEMLERTPARDPEKRSAEARTAYETTRDPLVKLANVRALPEYKVAFHKWLAGGLIDLTPEERALLIPGWEVRALSTTNATAGGFLVDDELQNRIEQAMSFFGGMREIATIIRTDTGGDFSLPTSNDTTNSGRRLPENTTLTQTDPTIGLRTWRSYTYTSDLVLVPVQLLQDSVIAVDDWLTSLLGERIGRAQNTDFTLGTGVDQPQGIAVASVQGRAGAAGQTTSVIWDDLIFLEHAVNIAYRRGPGVGYMCHDQTLRDIRRLKDGEGRYLWQPGVTGGAPNTINGYPYTVNNDVATMAASARSIFFGKLNKYTIRDVRGIQMVRLGERYMDVLQVGFFGFSRSDGGLLDAGTNPVQHYANPAS